MGVLLASFAMNSVWARLVFVLLIIVTPIGAVMVLVARDDLNSGLDNLRVLQATAAAGRASVLRAWLDSAGRALSNEAAAARMLPADSCKRLAEIFIRRDSSFVAVRFLDDHGESCAAGDPLDAAPVLDGGAVDVGEEASYRVVARQGRVWIAASEAGEGTGNVAGLALLRPAALTAQLPPLKAIGETHIALLDRDGAPIAENNNLNGDWLPKEEPPPGAAIGWHGPDLLGREAMFVRAPLPALDLSVLMRFDETRPADAFRRFYFVCALQLALLGLLTLAYAATVRRDIVRWIRGVENAARARARDPESQLKAPVDAAMPAELSSVAEAFNTMADRALEHQTALKASLAENRVLMLEMHHRIKNSLQVIQSYLALIRRQTVRSEATPLLKIESRIAVLAVAYRMALTPHGLRAISVQPFLEELGAGAIANLRGPRQVAELHIRWSGEIDIDRAIPLGLGLVEALIAAFDGVRAAHIAVTLSSFGPDLVRLAVEADGQRDERQPPARVMAGLAAQLGAAAVATPRLVLCWDFKP
jgi:two-component system, sensor histidine kinase PdtaS